LNEARVVTANSNELIARQLISCHHQRIQLWHPYEQRFRTTDHQVALLNVANPQLESDGLDLCAITSDSVFMSPLASD
jgi:hypothetical protein